METGVMGDLDDDDCEGMEFVHLSHEELMAAQGELNRVRSEQLKNLDRWYRGHESPETIVDGALEDFDLVDGRWE